MQRKRHANPPMQFRHPAESSESEETEQDRFSLSDAGLAAVARGCKGLEKLSLIWCSSITSLGLTTIAQNCKTLKSLDLQVCLLFFYITDSYQSSLDIIVLILCFDLNIDSKGILTICFKREAADDKVHSLI